MNVLTVDIGNSNTKIDIWSDNEHLYHIITKYPEENKFLSLIEEYKVEGAAICSVNCDVTDIYNKMKDHLEGNVIHFTKDKSRTYNIVSSYRGQIGEDRLAAYIGALQLRKGEPLMIVDAGTAMTIDVVDRKGKFCGGNISLGLESRLKAMHYYTKRLPLVSSKGIVTDFGTNTRMAIRNGAVNGMVAEIIFLFHKANSRYKVERILFTGGDAKKIMSELESHDIEYDYDPYLVGKGLNADFRRWKSLM